MFDFDFQNISGFLFAFLPGLISFCLVIYILTALPRNRLITIFSLFTVSTGIWQMNDALCRISSSELMAERWESLLALGWVFAGPLCLHFTLLYTRRVRHKIAPWLIILLYVPAFAFLAIFQTQVYEHNLQYREFWGWVNYHDQAVLDVVMIYWIAVLLLLSCMLLFVYAFKVRHDSLLYRQALIIAFGIAIPTVAGIVSQVLLPTVFDRPSLPLTSSFLSFLSLAAVTALKKYRLFTVSELISSELLLDELPVVVLSISDTGYINYINKFGVDFLKIKRQVPGRLHYEQVLRHTVSEPEQSLISAFDAALKVETFSNFESTLEIEDRTANVLISASPIVNNKKVRGALLCIRDITALKDSEVSLQQSNIELKQKNANLEEFAFVASHDLKEPLRKIITFSGMIEKTEYNQLSDKSKAYFNRIAEASRRMQVMIDDILSLSLISKESRVEYHHLNHFVNEAVADLEVRIRETNALVQATKLPSAYVNPKQFRQLFLNLISNALKFSRKGVQPVISISGSILTNEEKEHLSLLKQTRYIKITVEDNGIGFENVYAEKMFQLFQRLHGHVDYEGTGLGLAICRKIVEQHKGIIYASGVLNQGAVFTIIIPQEPPRH